LLILKSATTPPVTATPSASNTGPTITVRAVDCLAMITNVSRK
jgi:hypothetical protein